MRATPLRAIREVRERLEGGRLDALVNNAAISPKGPGGSRLGLFETEFEDWSKVFQVNFFAPALLARGLSAELERAKGAVVNVTSIAGSRVHPFAGIAYATSKAALAALTREMAADFGPRGVRVNAISPGEIDTAILSPGTEKIVAQIPMRRLGTLGRSRQGDLFPLHGAIELRQRRGVADQRRPACLRPRVDERLYPGRPILAASVAVFTRGPRPHRAPRARAVGSGSIHCRAASWNSAKRCAKPPCANWTRRSASTPR